MSVWEVLELRLFNSTIYVVTCCMSSLDSGSDPKALTTDSVNDRQVSDFIFIPFILLWGGDCIVGIVSWKKLKLEGGRQLSTGHQPRFRALSVYYSQEKEDSDEHNKTWLLYGNNRTHISNIFCPSIKN